MPCTIVSLPGGLTKNILWRAVDVNRPVTSLVRSSCGSDRAGTHRYRGIDIPRSPCHVKCRSNRRHPVSLPRLSVQRIPENFNDIGLAPVIALGRPDAGPVRSGLTGTDRLEILPVSAILSPCREFTHSLRSRPPAPRNLLNSSTEKSAPTGTSDVHSLTQPTLQPHWHAIDTGRPGRHADLPAHLLHALHGVQLLQ